MTGLRIGRNRSLQVPFTAANAPNLSLAPVLGPITDDGLVTTAPARYRYHADQLHPHLITGHCGDVNVASGTATLTIDSNTYTGPIFAGGGFAIEVPGSVLVNATVKTVTLSITAQSLNGNSATASTSRSYTVTRYDPVYRMAGSEPLYDFQFSQAQSLDNQLGAGTLTFARASGNATYYDSTGALITSVTNDEPRFTYDPVTLECLGLMIEPQSTNLATRSEGLQNAAWTKTGCTAPINTKIQETDVDEPHYVQRTFSAQAAGTYTWSAYCEYDQRYRAWLQIAANSGAQKYTVHVNLIEGTILEARTQGNPTGIQCRLQRVRNSGYRIWISIAHTSGDLTVKVGTSISSTPVWTAGDEIQYLGDSTKKMIVNQLQFEAGGPTSYIPTTTDVTKTRSAETLTLSASLPQSGTCYVEAIHQYLKDSQTLVALDNGTSRVRLINTANAGNLTGYGSTIAAATTWQLYKPNHHIFAYGTNDVALSSAESTVVTGATASIPAGLNRLSICHDSLASTRQLHGVVRRFCLWNSRITNANLARLAQFEDGAMITWETGALKTPSYNWVEEGRTFTKTANGTWNPPALIQSNPVPMVGTNALEVNFGTVTTRNAPEDRRTTDRYELKLLREFEDVSPRADGFGVYFYEQFWLDPNFQTPTGGSVILFQAWQGYEAGPVAYAKILPNRTPLRLEFLYANEDNEAINNGEISLGYLTIDKNVWYQMYCYVRMDYFTRKGAVKFWLFDQSNNLIGYKGVDNVDAGKVPSIYGDTSKVGTDHETFDGNDCKFGIYRGRPNTSHRMVFGRVSAFKERG